MEVCLGRDFNTVRIERSVDPELSDLKSYIRFQVWAYELHGQQVSGVEVAAELDFGALAVEEELAFWWVLGFHEYIFYSCLECDIATTE